LLFPNHSLNNDFQLSIINEPDNDKYLEQSLKRVDAILYTLVALAELASITMNVLPTNVYFTDNSLIDAKFESPCRVFTTKQQAIYTALNNMKLNEPLEKFLILTNSLSSLKAMESKQISNHTNPMV
jgi:hypothetical protein